MKTHILLVTLLVIIFCHWSSASTTAVEQRKTMVIEFIGKKLRNLWIWMWNRKGGEFADRCFGVARRLKFAMPMIIFKLGVIVTILVFLTIFSMKTLGLLFLLVMVNSSGVAAKWAHAKQSHNKQWSQPPNVHFYLHSKEHAKEGHYTSHPDYEHGWYDKNYVDEDDEYESLDDRLRKLHAYENYYNKKH